MDKFYFLLKLKGKVCWGDNKGYYLFFIGNEFKLQKDIFWFYIIIYQCDGKNKNYFQINGFFGLVVKMLIWFIICIFFDVVDDLLI